MPGTQSSHAGDGSLTRFGVNALDAACRVERTYPHARPVGGCCWSRRPPGRVLLSAQHDSNAIACRFSLLGLTLAGMLQLSSGRDALHVHGRVVDRVARRVHHRKLIQLDCESHHIVFNPAEEHGNLRFAEGWALFVLTGASALWQGLCTAFGERH